MIRFTKDGKVDLALEPTYGELTYALDVAVAALRYVSKRCGTWPIDSDVDRVVADALRQLGADHAD